MLLRLQAFNTTNVGAAMSNQLPAGSPPPAPPVHYQHPPPPVQQQHPPQWPVGSPQQEPGVTEMLEILSIHGESPDVRAGASATLRRVGVGGRSPALDDGDEGFDADSP